jgi:hypothetical protein
LRNPRPPQLFSITTGIRQVGTHPFANNFSHEFCHSPKNIENQIAGMARRVELIVIRDEIDPEESEPTLKSTNLLASAGFVEDYR